MLAWWALEAARLATGIARLGRTFEDCQTVAGCRCLGRLYVAIDLGWMRFLLLSATYPGTISGTGPCAGRRFEPIKQECRAHVPPVSWHQAPPNLQPPDFVAASASPTPGEQPIRGSSPTLFDLTSSPRTSFQPSPYAVIIKATTRTTAPSQTRARTYTQHTVSSKVSTSRGSPRRPPNLTSDARVTSRRDRHLPTSTHCLRAMEEPGSREKTSSVGHMITALWPQRILLLMVVPVLACLVALRRRGLQLVIVDFQFVSVSPRQPRVKAALTKPGWAGSCPFVMDRGYDNLFNLAYVFWTCHTDSSQVQ